MGRHFRPGFQPSEFLRAITQGFALGWDMAALSALSEGFDVRFDQWRFG